MNDKINLKRVIEVMRDGKPSTTTVGWTPVGDESYAKYKEEELKKKKKQEEVAEVLKSVRMPWFCPECSNVMNKRLDDKFWRLYNKCMDCVVKEETHMRATGQYDLYEKEKMTRNAIGKLQDYKVQFELALEQTDSDNFIHEDGTIEKWSTIGDMDKIKKDIRNDLKRIEESLEQLDSDLQDIIKQKT